MTFDKSGQDTSLNVRVGVQVPQRGVTWFHLCIIDMCRQDISEDLSSKQ